MLPRLRPRLVKQNWTRVGRAWFSNESTIPKPKVSVADPEEITYDVPGLNCDISDKPRHPAYPYTERSDLYRTVHDGEPGHNAATTLRELRWQGMMNEITDKQDWQSKALKKDIQLKWKQEALENGRSALEGFSERMADKMIEELKAKVTQYETTKAIIVFDPGVVKSDTAVLESLRQELLSAVQPLESVPESAKDWHPGSNDQVLNLVHPSLWPLIYGKTRILPSRLSHDEDPLSYIGAGSTLPALSTADNARWQTSKVFQWLPAEVRFDENKQAKFASYINNLHPHRHKTLYGIIEKVIDAAIPLWSRTLSSWPIQQRITYNETAYLPMPPLELERLADETEDDYEERLAQIYIEMKPDYAIQPEPHDNEIKYDITDIKEKFHAGLQVIVKLANIELNPGESYAGGSWHVEGSSNEAIVATALYYYSNENIDDSRLAFRHTADPEEFGWTGDDLHPGKGFEQDDHQFMGPVFGTENQESSVQDLGSVSCREGRLITFPNTLAHRVLPFELKDKTKPGHRKLLALFLVDPHLRVVSTAAVPPQQPDWWLESIMQTRGIQFTDKLPPEIVQLICSFVGVPMSLETAKEWRLKLMEERSAYNYDWGKDWTRYEYNLCEH